MKFTGFPNTVDKLDPEYSLLEGQKPLMFGKALCIQYICGPVNVY